LNILHLPLKAQIDTEFWFVAPEITEQHADRPIYLRISSLQQATSISISQPANPAFGTINQTIAANQTISIDLTLRIDLIENKPADQILNFGIHILSSNPITAYYEVLGSTPTQVGVNSDIFVLKGNHALGKEFYVPFQTHWDNNHTTLSDAWSAFDIVATENNTLVTITPTKDVVGHNAGIPYTITLQKGETYSARATSPLAADHPAGSHVKATKPIAITVKDDSMIQGGNYDLAGDQIIPVNFLGQEYIAVKVSDTVNTDRVYILATQNNTTISFDGSGPVATLNAGQSYELHLLNPTVYITSSAPVYVWHVAGFENELGGAILPPLTCTGSRQVSFTRSTNELFYIEIVVKTGYAQYFILNGKNSLIPASAFSAVPGSAGGWEYAKIPFNASVIPAGSANLIKNDSTDFQFSILNGGNATGFRYGYFSDFGFLNLGPDRGFCEGDAITLNAGFYQDSILWNTGATSQYLTVIDSGYYSVRTKKGVCINRDTVHVFYFPKITTDVLGNDTAACDNRGLEIHTLFPFSSYLWNTGSTESFVHPYSSGMYIVTVANEYGCKKKDTVNITLYPSPNPHILYDKALDPFCKNPEVALASDQVYNKYFWSTGDTTQSIVTTHNENDSWSLRVVNSFGCTRSTSIAIDCSPVIGLLPNLLTPNDDGMNEIFYIEYLRPNKWTFEVYNRWGECIYKNDNYYNNFDPKELNLSDGVYYYFLHHHEGKGEYKGWVEIIH
jgi:hypothetical protein